jgi:hypothetical protein
MTDLADFNAAWAKIQEISPASFVEYLKGTWMSDQVVKMWSAVHRKNRTINELWDTNMLVEAYVLSCIPFLSALMSAVQLASRPQGEIFAREAEPTARPSHQHPPQRSPPVLCYEAAAARARFRRS